jgi:hypothetical protein
MNHLHRPFQITFKLISGELFAQAKINRKTNEFYYFPKYTSFLNDYYNTISLIPSHNDMQCYAEQLDHISLHKDGAIHEPIPLIY